MKAFKISTLFMLAALVVASCGQNTDTLEAKKARIDEARNEIKSLHDEIATLEKEIAVEDPDFGQVKERATLVTTVPAAQTEFSHRIQIRGNVQSRTNVYISAETMGQLTAVNMVEGQYVKKRSGFSYHRF